jgi:hypothetical protein
MHEWSEALRACLILGFWVAQALGRPKLSGCSCSMFDFLSLFLSLTPYVKKTHLSGIPKDVGRSDFWEPGSFSALAGH